jgi:hypothetical protein
MKKLITNISILTIIFLSLLSLGIGSAIELYNTTQYIDVTFICFLGGLLLFVYSISISAMVMFRK